MLTVMKVFRLNDEQINELRRAHRRAKNKRDAGEDQMLCYVTSQSMRI